MGTFAILGIAFLGMAVLASSIALRASDQCRRRVAHARIVAQAKRIDEVRREQAMARLAAPPMSMLPGLCDEA